MTWEPRQEARLPVRPADPPTPPSSTTIQRAPTLCFSSLGHRVVIATGDTIHCMRQLGDWHTQHQLPGLDSLALVGASELWAMAQGQLHRMSLHDGLKQSPLPLGAGPGSPCALLADSESHERTALFRQGTRQAPGDYQLLVANAARELIVRPLRGPLPDGCLVRPAGGHRVLVAANGQICVHDTRASTLAQVRVPVPGPIVAVELHRWGEWLLAFVATGDGIELVRLRADGSLGYRLLLPRFDHYSFDHGTSTLAIYSADEHTVGTLAAGAEPVTCMHELAAPFAVHAMHLGQGGRELHLFRWLPDTSAEPAGDSAATSYWRTIEARHLGIDGALLQLDHLEQRGHTRLLPQPGPRVPVAAAAPGPAVAASPAPPAPGPLHGSLGPYLRYHLAQGSLPTLRGLGGSCSGLRSDLALRSAETSAPCYDQPDLHVHDLLHLAVHNAAWVIAQDWHDGLLELPSRELDAAKQHIEEAVGLPLFDAPQLIKLLDSACSALFERIHTKVEGSLLRGIILPVVDLCEEFALADRDANLLLTIAAVELSPVFRRLVELAARGLGLAANNQAVLRYIALGDALDEPGAIELAPSSPLRRFGLVQVIPTIERGQLLVADPVILARLRGEPCTGSGVEAFMQLVTGAPPVVDVSTVSVDRLHALAEALAQPRADGRMHRVVLAGADGSGRRRLAAALAARATRSLALIDCAALADHAADALRMAMLRAKMRGALPCLHGLDEVPAGVDASGSTRLAALLPIIREHPGAVLLCTRLTGDSVLLGHGQAPSSRLGLDEQVIVVSPA